MQMILARRTSLVISGVPEAIVVDVVDASPLTVKRNGR